MESFKGWLRKKVSGKRNRLHEEIDSDEYDLDLTPITPRIYAMSFPAQESSWQAWYRNTIDSVREYIN